ncbi:MAG: HEAT repeat domain-containing protein [Gemmataceae bacterium]
MRYSLLFVLSVGLCVGCSKKKEPVDTAPEPEETKKSEAESTAENRAYWFKALKSKDLKARQEASDQLEIWAETDPETITGLLDLLKDKTTNGPGKTLPRQICSTRQLAADILSRSGPKGQAALKEKGLPILREGLKDPDPAIREHTVFTLQQLGSVAHPVAPDILKLCNDPDPNVYGRAFDALAVIGIDDPVAITALLTSANSRIVGLAATLLAKQTKIPPEAVKNLIQGLESKQLAVRTASATALVQVGSEAAPATDALIKVINDFYPKEYDPTKTYEPGGEMAYWRALAVIGEPAVIPVATLLAHTNPFVRMYAAQTLGDIGPPAKAAAPQLKETLKDSIGDVAVEAACTLCRLDDAKDEAIDLVKRAMDAPGRTAQYAIESIPRLGEAGKSLIPVACAKITSDNLYARYAAVGVISTLDREEAAKFAADLAKLVGERPTETMSDLELRATRQIRQRSLTVLWGLGPAAAPAAETLAKLLPAEKDAGVRDQLTDVLIAMGPGAKPAVSALLAIAQDTSTLAERRGRILAALMIAAPDSKELAKALLKTADEGDTLVRVMVTGLLASLDPMPPEALTKLVQLANDRTTAVRVAALRSLAAAGPKAKPVKADLEKIAAGNIPEFALPAKVALASMDGNIASVANDVRTALKDRNTQVRLAAVECLLLIGPTEADIPALQKLMADRSDSTKEAAAKCVARLGPAGKDAVPQLIQMLEEREGNVRIAAAFALGEIGPGAKDAVEKLRQMRGGSGRGDFGDPLAGYAAGQALAKILGAGSGPAPTQPRPKKKSKK